MKWLDEVVALNPTRPQAYMERARGLLDQQNWTKGLNDITKAIELDPNNAAAYAWRGGVYHRMGRYGRAISDYERSLQIEPDRMHVLNNLAWLLATCPEDEIRDGPRAVGLARRACELSKWQNPPMLGTLAAAYAETGQFEKAIEYQEKAISLVSEEKSDEYRQPLELYHQRTPRRDSSK
jgi:tetratricopeptide (TPR) repeat protein